MLLVVESVRVLNGSTLDTLNSVLLFVGLGALAVGGIMLVIAVVAEDEVGAGRRRTLLGRRGGRCSGRRRRGPLRGKLTADQAALSQRTGVPSPAYR